MTKKARQAAGVAVVMAVLGWTSRAAAAESSAAVASQEAITGTHAGVRGLSPRLVAVITEAAAQSKTFRGLIDRIGNTDGIVFVADARCGHGVRACLLHAVTIAGPNRLLWIVVDPRKTDREAMRSIGHELQHAVEVLDALTSGARMQSTGSYSGSAAIAILPAGLKLKRPRERARL